MSVLTFKGGTHPPDGKQHTMDKPITVVQPKENAEMVFPLSQHIGAPCDAIVEKGQQVLVGQKIADSSAPVSSPIYSSVSGAVKDIKMVAGPTGAPVKAIIIENDGQYKEIEMLPPAKKYTEYSRDELIQMVREAGIVGLGGAGFPTHIKLNTGPDKKIDTILVNAAECEPYLTTDYRIMLEETEYLVEGLQIMLHIHPEAKGIIAIENNKPEAIKVVTEAVKDIPNITVATLQTKYPQGAEKQLIYACTKREVPSGGLPADIGCIVDNVDTVVAIQRAIVRGRPLMRRIVTLSGGAVKNPGNYKIRLGMSIQELVEETGGFSVEPAKMILGGPMMGPAIYSLDVPFIKATSALLCFTEEETVLPVEQNCIRCGKCVEQCPIALMPLELNRYVLNDNYEAFLKYHGTDCIECGCCSYGCPAKRHLAQSIREGKKKALAILRNNKS